MCRAIAEKVNEGAVDSDRVSSAALKGRVLVKELGREKSLSAHSEQIESIATPESGPHEQSPEEEAKARSAKLASHIKLFVWNLR